MMDWGDKMKTYSGNIKFNVAVNGYGMMGSDGAWVKEKLEDGDRIDIVVNGVLLKTTFKQSEYSRYLEVQPLNGWDYLTTLPAEYHEIELKSKTSKATVTKNRFITGAVMLLCSIGITLFLTILFSFFKLESLNYVERFIQLFKMMFWFFGAGVAVAGILAFTIPSVATHCAGFGMALYYGTVLLSGFLDRFITADLNERLIISFVIVALCCYIYWLKKLKPKAKEDY